MTRNIQEERLKAPDLVLDLLIAGADAMSARALCRAGEVMGVAEIAMRVALSRLCQQGKVRQASRGMYEINRDAGSLIRNVEGWRNRDRQMTPWKKTWVAVHDAAVPRSDRAAWRHHSLALNLSGFAEFQPGLYLRPDNLVGGVIELRASLAELGLSALSQVFCVSGLTDRQFETAVSLWRTHSLAAVYDSLTEQLERGQPKLACPRDQRSELHESLLLGRKAITAILRDPLLPKEMMAVDHRRRLIAATERYQHHARLLWRDWLSRIG